MPDRHGRIRQATAADAPELTAVAMRSKAHWGYDAEFMRRVAPLLDFGSVDIEREHIYVLEADDPIAGFYRLSEIDGRPFLDDLWVDPPHMCAGIGRRLWFHALDRARDLGWTYLEIESEPSAEGFYLCMGARRVGEQRSSTGRLLPLLRIDL